jgi:hypothetical protein
MNIFEKMAIKFELNKIQNYLQKGVNMTNLKSGFLSSEFWTMILVPALTMFLVQFMNKYGIDAAIQKQILNIVLVTAPAYIIARVAHKIVNTTTNPTGTISTQTVLTPTVPSSSVTKTNVTP